MQTLPEEHSHWAAAKTLLFLLLAADALFIGVHLVHVLSGTYLQDALYSIETDGGFSEWFQYIKEGWIAILCFALWKRTRSIFLVGWAFLFGYFLLDDSMQIHELGGESIGRHLHLSGIFGLRPQDLGELAVSGIVGLVFLFTIGFTYLKAPRNEKHISQDIAFLVAMLVVAGVGVDALHAIVVLETKNLPLQITLALLEDGAEMLVMSVICWYAFGLLLQNGVAEEERVWRRIQRWFVPVAAANRRQSA